MENCEIVITPDEKLIITIDLSRECGMTNSGRSVCVATTGGNVNLWSDGRLRAERLNVNVFRPISKAERQAGQVHLKKGSDDD